ncbi:sterile20-like kinase isoform X2 [Oratosquilla oratoria]|uniref:sterile20-like kinase isoform X2 n=1 Tax=Oratosquilla oratoria TaxID=337810 RepID=UPI003F75D891
MMPLLSKVKDIFKGSASNKKKKVFHNVKIESPEEYWDIIGELGDGAYGKVYKAQHKEHHTLAALKQVKLEAEEDLETFMIEIDILSECKHENIVQLLEAYHFDGYLWMYLEYCDGGAVDSIMADLDRPLTEPQIAYLCQNLCHALKYVHDNKVIHRDLKAGNVLLMMDGGVKLADFGVSAKNKNTLDKRGTFIGTPYWLAPEVILCETFIDAKYDYKADIWSLGISLIEFAQMDPPNHEVSPVRVMLKIQKSDPPKLDYPTKYSREFNDFVAKCLVKDPNQRPSAEDLLKHPFLDKVLDAKPIIDLLLEYKAEVVEEEVVEDLEEQRISTQSLDSEEQSVNSHDDTESIASCNIVGDKISHVESEEMVVSPRRNIKEVPTAVSGERRLSKGPAPSPPISQASTPSTPTAPSQPSSTASTPSKKGPAPAVPSTTTTTTPAPTPTPTVTTPTKVPSPISSTPAGKGPAPKPMAVAESPIASHPVTKVKPDTDVPHVEKPKDIPDVCTIKEPSITIETQKKENVMSDEKKVEEGKSKVSPESENLVVEKSADIKPVTIETPKEKSIEIVNTEIKTHDKVEKMEIDKTDHVKDKEGKEEIKTAVSVQDEPDTSSISISKLPVEPMDVVITSEESTPAVKDREETTKEEPVSTSPKPQPIPSIITTEETPSTPVSSPVTTPPPADSRRPIAEPTETILASIVPIPAEEETSAPVSLESRDEDGSSNEKEDWSNSLSEAEAQAVRILESVIDSAVESRSRRNSFEEKESAVVVTGSEVSVSEDRKLSITQTESKEGITEVTISTSPDQGHRLDASEVVISNSSILHDNEEVEPVTKSKYEITLEEVSEAEQDTRESIPRADDTHISVVTVDDQAPGTTVTVTPGPVTAKTKSPTSDSSDQQNVDTSSNISNMSNISMTSHSTTGGRSVSSGGVCAEEVEEQNEGRPTSLVIEGTTVGATDVDDDVFDHSDQHDNKTPTSAKTSISQDSALESETSGSTSSQQRTPKTHSISSSTSTSQTSTPAHHIVQNGSIGKDNHIISDSKSDTDSISTASSEKENTKPKQRLDNGENFEEVVLRPHHRQKDSSGAFKPADRHNKEGRTAEELETMALRKKTRKRTRKFVIDGVVVTTTTSKVIYGDDEEKGTLSSGHLARKQELRELKILQKMEQKQFQELAVKANFAKQEQEKKFDVEKQQLLRSYEVELESLNRQQKQQVERAEYQQELDLKQTSKKIRAEQEKELKAFRDSLKTELKLLKQEIDLLPKDKRKDNFKVRREKLDQDQNERERSFLEGLHESHETMLKRLGDSHREKIAMLEQQFLQQKHQLLRQRESALWEMEEKHLHEKHQLAKRQLKDIFFLQRHQMLLRHDKELEQVKRVNQQKEEDLIKRQQIEKRQLPKRIRQEMKARELMFRESMRISISHLPDSHEDEKERLKKFQEGEKRRYEAEKRRAEQKHRKQLEELLAASDSTIKELEQLQNEKRKVLMEHETFKLKCQDEDYQKELKEWKTNLKPRKQKLEEEFEKQLKEQQQFYGAYLTRSSLVGLESNSTTSLTKA